MHMLSTIVVLAALAMTGNAYAGSGRFKCRSISEYTPDAAGRLTKVKPTKTISEILFDANSGELVWKYRYYPPNRLKIRVLSNGDTTHLDRRWDVTAYAVRRMTERAPWMLTLSIRFTAKQARLLLVQGHWVTHGTCDEM